MNQELFINLTCSYSPVHKVLTWKIVVRYDAAVERKSKILDIIRSLDLPNNPLDDIIDQVIELSTWEH